MLVAVVALVAAACAEGDVATDDLDTTTTAAVEETTTTVAPTTTSAATTTEATETTTSTEAPSGPASAFDELVARVENAPELASGRMEVSVSISGLDPDTSGVPDASFGFTTAFDTASESSAFSMDLSSLATAAPADPDDPFGGLAELFTGTMEVRQIGDTAYVKMPFFNELLGVDTPWLSMSAEDGDGFTSDFSTVPSDPTEVMTAYDGADVVVEDLGSETVNGVEATHYRLVFDTSTWLAELTADERAELEASGLLADGVLGMDIWVRDDGHLVRLLFAIDGSTIEAPPGEGFEAMTMQYDLLDINEPVSITAPPASEVTNVDDLGFADFDFSTDA